MAYDFEGKCIYIIGAGQIGFATALQLVRYHPKRIVFHALTKEEVELVKDKFTVKHPSIEVAVTYGDIFLPYSLLHADQQTLQLEDNQKYLLNFYYTQSNRALIEESSLYQLVKEIRPNVIIDSINTATIFGKNMNRNISSQELFASDVPSQTIQKAYLTHLLNDFIPKLNNFLLALKLSLEMFQVEKYVKVSTTGLGGMGLNMQFTHGDEPEFCLSKDILGKLSASGAMHQLLWALARTPGFDISVIVPATCVGWEDIFVHPVRNTLGVVRSVDSVVPQKLQAGEILQSKDVIHYGDNLSIPIVNAGENLGYSLPEITALTSYGQMEAITKEEVAEAIIKDVQGVATFNLLHIADRASLGSTYAGRRIREIVLHRLSELEVESEIPSIVTGNLGPTVAKHLAELYLIKMAVSGQTTTLLKMSAEELASKVRMIIFDQIAIRVQLLSVGLPIVLSDDEILIGERWIVPEKENQIISLDALEIWIKKGWADLRVANMQLWLEQIKEVLQDAARNDDTLMIDLIRDRYAVQQGFDIGEILSYRYIIDGAGKRIN